MNLMLTEDDELSEVELETLLSIGKTIALALANARYVKWTEQEIRRREMAEERYALATSAARIGVWDWNLAAGEFFVDANVKALVGYSDDEIPNDLEAWTRHVHPEDVAAVSRAITEHLEGRTAEFTCEHRMLHKDGSIRWILARGHAIRDAHGTALRMVGTDADVTERKRLEAQILHAEKLKSLGILAGGIAHDFNNLLTGILGHAELARMRIDPASPARPFLDQVDVVARRASELTRQLLAYSGGGVFQLEPVDLSALVGEMTELLGLSISKKAVIRHEQGRGLPHVEGDPAQLRQVVMNLMTNASEALGDAPGEITVRLGVVELGARGARFGQDVLPGGRYVRLEIADTGCGMDEATMARIFDPFFTTKFAGRGLGMAAAQGIVRGHRGGIEVDSAPGRGTRIRILLPALAARAAAPVEVRRTPAQDLGGGIVLVVDDEQTIRDLAREVLAGAGFTVLLATDGEEALRVFSRRADEIRLVLLDLTMPRMDGRATLEALTRIESRARVILTSGYRMTGGAHHGASAFLEKPFTPAALVEVVREALER
jgi:PAS domain S-box-containing protein